MSQIQEQFIELGYSVVDFQAESDIILINTCTVTHNADADCRKIIHRAKKISPDAFIGVMGCYSQLNPGEIAEIEGVDAIFGIEDKYHIPELIQNYSRKDEPHIFISDNKTIPFHTACSIDNESHTRAVLKIQDGCDYYCSYCIVPYARGECRSMYFEELKNTILKFSETKVYEIILLGINLGEYEASTGENFLDVIKFISQLNIQTKISNYNSEPRIQNSELPMRFRISSIEPNLLSNEIINIVQTSKNICPHFHIPLQSGSPEILKLMHRRYKVEKFKDLIYEIKEKIPDCCIGVDVITGFPGETDLHFKETYELIKSLPISYLHVFTYSERKGTKAFDLDGKVNPHVRKERTKLLRMLSELKKAEFYKSQIGSIRTVIPEVYDSITGLWNGWTENYIRVKFAGKNNLGHHPIKVRLDKLDGEYVSGISK